jgi:hypothetical protein
MILSSGIILRRLLKVDLKLCLWVTNKKFGMLEPNKT